MSVPRPLTIDLNPTIARGEWWMRLFDELSGLGVERCRELARPGEAPSRGVIQAFCRVARAVRMAVVAATRLDQILSVLADLRKRSAADIAAAQQRAKAKADEDTAREQAREKARDQARAGREARTAEIGETVVDRVERAKPEPRDRDPLVEALDKRLAAVDPVLVDFDDLKLRETVLRICADIGVTPDWVRWEAGEWATSETPAPAASRISAPPPTPNRPPQRGLRAPLPAHDPQRAARAAEKILSRLVMAQGDPAPRRPTRRE